MFTTVAFVGEGEPLKDVFPPNRKYYSKKEEDTKNG